MHNNYSVTEINDSPPPESNRAAAEPLYSVKIQNLWLTNTFTGSHHHILFKLWVLFVFALRAQREMSCDNYTRQE